VAHTPSGRCWHGSGNENISPKFKAAQSFFTCSKVSFRWPRETC
jgi:hypothetical protein